MKNWNKTRILYLALGILVALNGVTLFIVLRNGNTGQGNGQRPHMRPMEYLIDAVKMDEAQQAAYRQLAEKHHQYLDSMQPASQASRHDFFALISSDAPDSVWQAAQDRMDGYKRQLDDRTFRHFREVSRLLRPDQIPAFNEAVVEILRKPPPRRQGGKDGPPHPRH